MARRFAVGLFESRGIAEDACHRLKTEGVPGDDIALAVLREIGPTPSTMAPELDALSVDPLVWGDVHRNFARFIRNGETVVFVRVATEEAARFARDVLRQYAPIGIDVFSADQQAPLPPR